jgi:hypothetical protein
MKRRCEIPVLNVNFAKATHAERASDRLDARTPWTVKLSVSVYYILWDSVLYSRNIFYASSLSHVALPIISSHPQPPSFSSRHSVPLFKLMNTRSSPSSGGQSFFQGSL